MLVMINKYDPSYPCWPYLMRRNRIVNQTVEKVIGKYAGFEGEVISSISLSENKEFLVSFIKDYSHFYESNKMLDLLIVSSEELKCPKELAEKFSFVGYDFGTDEDDYMCSSIFNEILFGCEEKLIAFKDYLNEHFLFSNRSLVDEYALIHHQLSNKRANVEYEYGMAIFKIWKYKT